MLKIFGVDSSLRQHASSAVCKTALLSILLNGALFSAQVGAASISTTLIPKTNSDANSDVSSSYTYTHALNFATNNSLTLNGVQFTPTGAVTSSTDVNYGGTLAQTLDSTSTGLGTLSSNGSIQADGIAGQIIDTFSYSLGAVGGSSRTFEFGGLTAGNRYRANFYGFDWGDTLNVRRVDIRTTDPFGAKRKIVDWADPTKSGSPTDHQAFYISVDYVAASDSQDISMRFLGPDSAHVGAVTNYLLEENALLLGDVNLNGVINLSDFAILGDNMLATGVGYGGGDLNGDGIVNIEDYRLYKDSPFRVDGFDTLAAEAANNVPEPSGLLLASLACLLGLGTTRRRN